MWAQPILSWSDWAWAVVRFPQLGPSWELFEVGIIQLGPTWVKWSMVEVGHLGLGPVGQIIHGVSLGYSIGSQLG